VDCLDFVGCDELVEEASGDPESARGFRHGQEQLFVRLESDGDNVLLRCGLAASSAG
jgi:hypothetical protein